MKFIFFILAILAHLGLQGQESMGNHPLLIAFLGPNDCPWSQKLDQEVLNDKEFIENIASDLIIFKVQFGKNSQLKEKYQIQEYPFFVLVDSTGEQIARIQYVPLSSKDFAFSIKELLYDYNFIKMAIKNDFLLEMPFEQLKLLYQKAERLENDAFKTAILEKGLQLDIGGYFLFKQYIAFMEKGTMHDFKVLKLRHKILGRDPKNEHGTHLKVAICEFETLVKKSKKVQRTLRPLMNYVHEFGKKDQENLWKVEMMIAEYLFTHNFVEEALKHAELSKVAAPESARENVSQSIEYFKAHR